MRDRGERTQQNIDSFSLDKTRHCAYDGYFCGQPESLFSFRLFSWRCGSKPTDIHCVSQANDAITRKARSQKFAFDGCAGGDHAVSPTKQPKKDAVFPVLALCELADIIFSRDAKQGRAPQDSAREHG
jgi:hypothetical protein